VYNAKAVTAVTKAVIDSCRSSWRHDGRGTVSLMFIVTLLRF